MEEIKDQSVIMVQKALEDSTVNIKCAVDVGILEDEYKYAIVFLF